MVFGISDNFHAAAALDHRVTFRHTLRSVIGSFGVNIGANFADEGAYVRLGKDDNSVDI
jgi:hypothetical protein